MAQIKKPNFTYNEEEKSALRKKIMKKIYSERLYDVEMSQLISERYWKVIGKQELIPDLSAELIDLLSEDANTLDELLQLINESEIKNLFTKEESQLFRDILAISIIQEEAGHIWGIENTLTLAHIDKPFHIAKNYYFNSVRNLQQAMNQFLESRPMNVTKKEMIKDILYQSTKLAKSDFDTDEAISHFQQNKILSVDTGWSEHGTNITVHQSLDGNVYLYYTNRGDESPNRDIFSADGDATTDIFMVQYEVTKDIVDSKGHLDIPALKKFLDRVKSCSHSEEIAVSQAFLEGKSGMLAQLGLQNRKVIGKSRQKIDNCSTANAKGGIQAMLIAMDYDAVYENEKNRDRCWSHALKSGTKLFKEFEFFGKKIGLKKILEVLDDEKCSVSAKDRFKMVALVSSKLMNTNKYDRYFNDAIKYAEEDFSDSSVLDEIREMKTQLLEYTQKCHLPLLECSKVYNTTYTSENLIVNMKIIPSLEVCENGAFIIAQIDGENRLYVKENDEIHSIILEHSDLSLQELVGRYPAAKYPI